jgi:hypothetical protein
MKILLISLVAVVGLFGRLNPFEPVANDTNQTKKLRPIQVSAPVKSIDDGNRTVKIMPHGSQKPKPTVIIKEKIVEKKLTKEQLVRECKSLKIIPKPIKKKIIVKKPKPKPKPKKFVPHTYKVLPFLTINSNKNNISIKTRKRYKLIRYYIEPNEKKFVFDFKAKVKTYTKHKNLKAPYFRSYIVGNHPENNYFRVVIVTKKSTKKYKVSMKNNIAVIKYKK